MSIPVHSSQTGSVFLRDFDEGVLNALGAVSNPNAFRIENGQRIPDPCHKIEVAGESIPVYFSQPEQVFRKKVYPFVTINRDDFVPAMNRWHGPGQLEYKAGVGGLVTIEGRTGHLEHSMKFQAYPYDITYTVSCWDRYENTLHPILAYVLRRLPPIGRIVVKDSLNLVRSYELYGEGSVAALGEIIDPVTRARGYAITIRVEGEMDLSEQTQSNAVGSIELNLHKKV